MIQNNPILLTIKNRILIFSILLTFSVIKAEAQNDEKTISANFTNSKIDQVVKELTAKSGYRFYYDPVQFDSLNVSFTVSSKTVSEVLTLAFNNTAYKYAVDDERKIIFLTKHYQINISLPTNLYPEGKAVPKVIAKNSAEIFSDTVLNTIAVASIENKLYEIGLKTSNLSGSASLAGYVYDIKSGEPLTGVQIYIEKPRIGVSTNQFGFYSITLPKGRNTINLKGMGLRDSRRQIMLYSDGRLNIELKEQIFALKEVVISSEKASNINSTTMGLEKLDIKTIKQVPTVFGEADILRVILTLPGVKSVGEASTGFNVRGGATDQNLILFNDATVYNPSHFFGFFSAFNPEVVKDVELYKNSIPAKYGGRIASVLDVSSREGNKKKIAGTAGLGLITSRLNIEGPIVKDKTSFILGGRTTYSNWLLNLLPEKSGYKNAKASFYDFNLNISHQANEKNNIYFTGYLSDDQSDLGTDTAFAYKNVNASLKWKHVFNNKLYGTLTTGLDKYGYNNFSSKNPVNAYRLGFDIDQANLKADFNYYPNSKHTIGVGLSSIYFQLQPGKFEPLDNKSLITLDIIPQEQAIENALYISDNFTLSPKLSLDYGIRYSLYNYLGPQSVKSYTAGQSVSSNNIIDSVKYDNGDFINNFHGPELRLSGRFTVTKDFSIKAGFNTLRQYIHLLTNTTSISPTDIWKLSDPNIRPQLGNQVSLGFYKNFKSNTIETSAEVYYKNIKNHLDYKSGAVLVMNHDIEQDVVNTRGKAYGIEFLIKKLTGKLNGWLSYTYSRTLLKMDDPHNGPLINDGKYYPANYDKPHDLTMIGNYRFSHRFSTSVNVTYSTGRPITLPIAKFNYAGSQRVYYSDRNEYRIPDYFRTDFSINIEGNHKVHQLLHNSWTIGVYNLSGRKNAYSTYYNTERGAINGYKLTIFGSPVPFVNYNIRF